MFEGLDPDLTSLIVGEEESQSIEECLARLMGETGATYIMLLDRAGQVLAWQGEGHRADRAGLDGVGHAGRARVARRHGGRAGIEDRERGPSSNLLANVNPTFNWVRLAQRIPVRVRLDKLPDDRRLIMGRTVSVDVLDADRPLPAKLSALKR